MASTFAVRFLPSGFMTSMASPTANLLRCSRKEIAKCTHRHFSTGFYFGRPGEESQIYDSSTYVNEYTYLGTVEEIWAGSP